LFESIHSDSGEIVISQTQHDMVFFIKQLRFDDSAPMSTSLNYDKGFGKPAIEASMGISGSGITYDYRGEETIAVWDYVPLTRWGIVAKIDTAEAFMELEKEVDFIHNMIIGFTGFSIIVGLIFAKIITNPLFEIKNAILRVSHKDYTRKLKTSKFSEYETIMHGFNEMIKTLQENQKMTDQHIDELRKIDIQKGEFAAMAAHELKTPLVPIKGYLEMLLETGLVGKLTSKQEEMLNKIYENTETMEKLVLRLLTAQRLDLGQMAWSISEFDILDLMESVCTDNHNLLSDKQIDFINNTKESKMISSDYDKIKEVFSNLIANSVDFVQYKGKIKIDAKIDEDKIIFSVKDDGVGISKEHQEGVFKKFYQVDTSVTRKHGGTGLGLSICKGLVEGLGGKIWINSEEGKGCEISFSIPITSKK
jgi:signal transduction histidine kinase